MAIRNALPFEFPWRWNDIRRFFQITDEATDYLDQRDRDLEDYLASLGDGWCAEAFQIDSTATIASGVTSDPVEFNPLSIAYPTQYHTDGVTGIARLDPNAVVTVPIGLWTLGISGEITATAAPVSGVFTAGFTADVGGAGNVESGGLRVPVSSFGGTATASILWSRDFYFAAETDVSVWATNGLDRNVSLTYFYFNGKRLESCDGRLPAAP